MTTSKWCCFCGRPGHLANKCDWPRDVPPPVPIIPNNPENLFDDQQEDWMDYYGGY